MATVDKRTVVKRYYSNRRFETPYKTDLINIDWSVIFNSGDTYEVLALPANALVLRAYGIITTTFVGASGTLSCGVNDGTEDDVDFYWTAVDGAVANLVARSLIGAPSVALMGSTDGTDNEMPLAFDTVAKNITLTTATTDWTAGVMILVVDWLEVDRVVST